MADGITIDFRNYDQVIAGMRGCQKELAKGVRRTELDMAKRGVHTVVRQEVTKVYNIKKSDIPKGRYDETGSISLAGVNIPFFCVTYSGKTFTPVHFGMTPKARPASNRRYTVKWKPLKTGGKTELKSDRGFPVFLAAPRGVALPWSRIGKQRKPIEVIRTHLAVPQTIDNEKVQPNIEAEIAKRIEQGLDRYVK